MSPQPPVTRTSRDDLACALERVDTPACRELAGALRTTPTEGTPIPCWGALTELASRSFESDEEAAVLWSVVLRIGDARMLLVFLDVFRGRPAVLRRVGADVARLPVLVQRAFVALPEAAAIAVEHAAEFHPAARQLVEEGADALLVEQEQFEAWVSQLRALRYFVPTKAPREPDAT